MAKDEHVALLEKGVEAWNAWREENPDVQPDLSAAQFFGKHLSGVNFRRANLRGASLRQSQLKGGDLREANLREAHLDRADLRNTKLGKADFSKATLVAADLTEADLPLTKFNQADLTSACLKNIHAFASSFNDAKFNDADLSEAGFFKTELANTTFTRADLRRVQFSEVKLDGANFSSANLARASLIDVTLHKGDLEGANLADAVLSSVNLTGSNLKGTIFTQGFLTDVCFTEADLTHANLSGADIRSVIGMRLNLTFLRDARFSPQVKDPWSILRRNYTGPRLLFTLLFLIAFFLPYVAKTLLWSGINHAQEGMILTVQRLEEAARDLEREGHPTMGQFGLLVEEFSKKKFKPCLRSACEETPVWKILIGVDKGGIYWVLAALLLVYNIFRGVLTWIVGPLRDEEERSGYSPCWNIALSAPYSISVIWQWLCSRTEVYGWLLWPHKAVRVLFWLSMLSFFWNAGHWLFSMSVWLPA